MSLKAHVLPLEERMRPEVSVSRELREFCLNFAKCGAEGASGRHLLPRIQVESAFVRCDA